jgi:uncharacterized protein (TIGR02452 family)
MARDAAAALGRHTLSILQARFYRAPSGRTVSLESLLAACRAGTIDYPPGTDPSPPSTRRAETRISIENATVLDVGRRMAATGAVAALNFASGTHPGGGFLSGARAQEEAIARSSGLFHALDGRHMYTWHRELGDPMYSDYVIYSPGVPVFRTDEGVLLEDPWTLAILTSPAVNGSALWRFGVERMNDIPDVMRGRVLKVLGVAAHHQVTRLILGAWGCGAFGLDPAMMAGLFRDALDGPFSSVFDEVVFAITDWSEEERTIGPFRRAFAG